jgi:hypothetical protein
MLDYLRALVLASYTVARKLQVVAGDCRERIKSKTKRY